MNTHAAEAGVDAAFRQRDEADRLAGVVEDFDAVCQRDQAGAHSAETALRELEKTGERVSMLLTDVNPAGKIDGVELAHFAHECHPKIHVVVTSGSPLTRSLPDGATFMPQAIAPARRVKRGRTFTALTYHHSPFAEWHGSCSTVEKLKT